MRAGYEPAQVLLWLHGRYLRGAKMGLNWHDTALSRLAAGRTWPWQSGWLATRLLAGVEEARGVVAVVRYDGAASLKGIEAIKAGAVVVDMPMADSSPEPAALISVLPSGWRLVAVRPYAATMTKLRNWAFAAAKPPLGVKRTAVAEIVLAAPRYLSAAAAFGTANLVELSRSREGTRRGVLVLLARGRTETLTKRGASAVG